MQLMALYKCYMPLQLPKFKTSFSDIQICQLVVTIGKWAQVCLETAV